MNSKQTIPLAVALAPAIAAAPVIIIGGLIGLGIVWLIKSLGSDKTQSAAETDPPKTELETSRKTTENTRKEAEKPEIREIPVTQSVPHVAVHPISVRPVPTVAAIVQPLAKVVQTSSPVAKKTITRGDMAMIFEAGKRSMSRLDAVAALKRLGFGKTAAYSATAQDGRFSAWLFFASDGIICWAEKRQNPEIP